VSRWTPLVEREDYLDAISSIRQKIEMGDTYQVNYTFPLRATFSGDPREFYRDLALAQRGSYGAYIDAGRFQVVSASPERFFSMNGGRVDLRPMKGTIRRGRWPLEDVRLGAELVSSEKDRAENLMIVDLLRNDLGRIADMGSVEVARLFSPERYETLWQLTSDITGRVPAGTTLREVFTALFPSGSVTGAPKVSTMGIIAELEPEPRGVYCGAVGYVGPPVDGHLRAEFNVAIRTVTIDTDAAVASYGVGGAITWDSSADGEYEEALLKAKLLVDRRPSFELLETIRWEPSAGFLWLDYHLARLEASAAYFGFVTDGVEVMEALNRAVARGTQSLRVRLTESRDGAVSAEAADLIEPFVGSPNLAPTVRVAVATDPVSADNVFLFHKTTNRRLYSRRLDLFPTADDVLLVNEEGRVTESAIANVAVRIGGTWYTPPVADGLLGGVYRRVLLEQGVLEERSLPLEEATQADEIALINSVRGWRRVRLLS
jgi:para-aminobenzoate synthetase/4-amino-4-deoxychorismate lyase